MISGPPLFDIVIALDTELSLCDFIKLIKKYNIFCGVVLDCRLKLDALIISRYWLIIDCMFEKN